MKIARAKQKGNGKIEYKHPGWFADQLREAGHAFLSEQAFLEVLRLERKRTERSGKPFLLMLLTVDQIPKGRIRNDLLREIASALFAAAREVDVKGWYEHGSVMGVIFTEISDTDEKVTGKIFTKVYQSLCRQLGVDIANWISISMHVFPEQETDGESDGSGFDPNLYPDLSTGKNPRKLDLTVKRCVDVMASCVFIASLAPVLLTLALLVKITSKGPVLFRQERVGRFGKRFTFLKFRSMYVNCDEAKHKEFVTSFITESRNCGSNGSSVAHDGVYKITKDPRVTPIGRILRKTSLDELPQFFNVLRGDMSLVGPRPPIPYECEKYDVWHRGRILEVKPGITGLWQVMGRSSTTFDEMVRLDLRYVRNWSLGLDFKILFQTPLAVVKGRGAY
jgi:lipopolysaccharide/colanic/teichoic acid biosynthesis glycosyltransferase